MPSSILNSDDGVISGTSGLKNSGGDDAVLLIQTNGTTAQTVDSGQRTKFPTTIGVGGATPSASGSGISFPATQSASSDANTLDDYEEGTWTPTLVGTGGGSFTYSQRSGNYTRVGRLVVLDCRLQWTATTSSGDFSNIQGLPFSTTAGLPIGSFRNNSFTVTGSVVGYISVHMELSQISQTGSLSGIPVTASGEIQFSVSYMG
jgi:hypothetical protein